MTYRERREARAERLRAWAEKRDAKAATTFGTVADLADRIPLGQPILVGHHSEGRARRDAERITAGMRTAIDHQRTAERMRSRADNIEQAAGRAIYTDDPDAPEALRARIADLEAERSRITAYNADCRRAVKAGTVGNTALLDERQRANLLAVARYSAYQLRPGGAMPPYATSNLSGRITAARDRLARLEGTTP